MQLYFKRHCNLVGFFMRLMKKLLSCSTDLADKISIIFIAQYELAHLRCLVPYYL